MSLLDRGVSSRVILRFLIGTAGIALGWIHEVPLLIVAGLVGLMMGVAASIEGRMERMIDDLHRINSNRKFPMQLESVRAQLSAVIGHRPRGPAADGAKHPWEDVQGVAESAIPGVVSELEIAMRPLRSEFNAAAAGAANQQALDEIAAVLAKCLADTQAARAKLRALTGRD